MKYKALMLDVDGTTVRYDYTAVPTDKVTEAIQEAQKYVTVCLVTGRSFVFLEKVFAKLQMNTGFVVVNNGAHVIDIASKKIIFEQLLSKKDTHAITRILKREKIDFALKGSPFINEYVQPYNQEVPEDMQSPMLFTNEAYSSERIDGILDELSAFPDISAHKVHHKNPNKFGLLICHVDATKQNGIYHLERHLGISREQMIGVGDSYNDFQLLMSCGLKVAMGNAVPELKAVADYIAPHVDNDGLVDVIEKFVLTQV